MAAKTPKFEKAIEQLETLIGKIESGEIGLEESIKHYEQGMTLVKQCRGILATAEEKIAELTVNDAGRLTVEDEDAAAPPPREDPESNEEEPPF